MDFAVTSLQQEINESVGKICRQFGDDYWRRCEEEKTFPHEFHAAMASAGWLGITMPEDLGGAGLGVIEAAIMIHAVTLGGGGYSAASAININLFGPHAIVVHGSPDQKQRWLKPLIRGEQKACFGFTEADAGLDTSSIKTFATRAPGGYRITGSKMWTSTGQVADKIVLLARTTQAGRATE
jgi:acyl-CoA dehydrogenase